MNKVNDCQRSCSPEHPSRLSVAQQTQPTYLPPIDVFKNLPTDQKAQNNENAILRGWSLFYDWNVAIDPIRSKIYAKGNGGCVFFPKSIFGLGAILGS